MVAIILFLTFAYVNEYRPETIEEIEIRCSTDISSDIQNDTLSIISWNIGYAGYEQSMDFFYDGGKRVRTTEINTEKNLQGIIATLKKYDNIDFMLLQEVDISSKRSYHINILDSLKKAFPDYLALYAPNYRCKYVPIPINDPIGKVECGLVILSRYRPFAAKRHRLPNSESFPTRMFNLKRCLLELSFRLPSGDTLSLINTHNTAYDDGSVRKKEIEHISSIIGSRKYCFICGDWNSNPPGYHPSNGEIHNHYFSPYQIQQSDFINVNYIFDSTSHTMRYLYEPYKKGHTMESLIDFAISTKNIKSLMVKTDEKDNYLFSDHNPVYYRIDITDQGAEYH